METSMLEILNVHQPVTPKPTITMPVYVTSFPACFTETFKDT